MKIEPSRSSPRLPSRLPLVYASLFFAAWGYSAGGYSDEPAGGPKASESQPEAPLAADRPVSVAVARDRTELMQRIYIATLDVMHERYFHSNRAVVPARAMEDVFAEMADKSGIESRWISVNTPAMSLPHEPRGDFERKAAKELAAGKPSYEVIEKGKYRRAFAVPLGDACISCHSGFFKDPPKTPRYAGLVFGMPITESKD